MGAIQPILLSMLESFLVFPRQVLTPVAPGSATTFNVRPSAQDLTFSPIVDVPLELSGISKNVSFANIDILSSTASAPIAGITGNLSRLVGTVALPLSEARVRVEARWRAQKQTLHTPLHNGGATVHSAPDISHGYVDLTEGEDFIAPEGLRLPRASFIFSPPVRRAKKDEAPSPVTRYVNAQVRLSSLGANTGWVSLPRVPIKLQPIALPLVLGCFQHDLYQGASIVFIPPDSPREIEKVKDLLTLLREIAEAIKALSALGDYLPILKLPSAIEKLAVALDESSHRHLERDDDNGDLSGYHLIKKELEVGPLHVGGTVGDHAVRDTRANDIFSSLILIGPPGTKATFTDIELLTGLSVVEKKLIMETGHECFVLVPNLTKPAASIPAGRITFDPPIPAGQDPPSWNNKINGFKLRGA